MFRYSVEGEDAVSFKIDEDGHIFPKWIFDRKHARCNAFSTVDFFCFIHSQYKPLFHLNIIKTDPIIT